MFPVDDPFAAASNLLQKLMQNQWNSSQISGPHTVGSDDYYTKSLEKHLQHQVERMVGHLDVGPDSKVVWNKKRQEYELVGD